MATKVLPQESVREKIDKSLEKSSASQTVKSVLRRLSSEEKAWLIRYAVEDIASRQARAKQVAVERAAFERECNEQEAAAKSRLEIEERKKARETERQAEDAERRIGSEPFYYNLYCNPSKCFDDRCDVFPSDQRRSIRKNWDKRGYDVEDWIRRAMLVTGHPYDYIAASYYPDGVREYYWDQAVKNSMERTKQLIKFVAEDTRMRVTEELLGSEFAIGDGRMVTWRDATESDHTERLEMLRAGIAGTAVTAAQHEKAIEIIRRHGVATLGELPVGTEG